MQNKQSCFIWQKWKYCSKVLTTMNLPDNLILSPWPLYAHCLLVPIVILALWTAPWYKIKASDSQHVFFGAIVILSFFWSIKAGITPGLNFHILGVMLFYLLFGWQFALFGLLLVLLIATIYGSSGWDTYSINALFMGVIPIFICHQLYSFVDKKLPNNYFIYVIVNGFLGGALALLSCMLSNIVFLILTETYSYKYLAYEYFPFMPLLLMPEALLNGLLISIFVAYRPAWVSTFDDERYIKGK
ncbi:MAG: energy-coupling factor ABC transporter permease [Pseudomonadota bacterium]